MLQWLQTIVDSLPREAVDYPRLSPKRFVDELNDVLSDLLGLLWNNRVLKVCTIETLSEPEQHKHIHTV